MDQLEIKATFTVGDAGQIAGYASLFGNPADHGRDIVLPGAFSQSLKARKPEMKSEHVGSAIGTWEEVVEDDMGLRVKGRFDLSSPAGRSAYADVIAGKKSGLSIGFITTKSAKDRDGVRILEQVELHEISVVRNPASSRSRILHVKSADAGKEGTMPDNEQGAAPEIAALETKMSALAGKVDAIKVPDVDKLVETIESRIADLEKKSNRPDAGKGDKEPTLERKAFGSYLRMGNQIGEEERKALNESNDAQGGYLVPPEFSTEILRDLVEYSPMRQVASIRNTSSPSVIYPVRTGETNARWVGEMETRQESTIGFGQKEIEAKELATFVELSNRLMQDAPQAETEVRLALAEDFGKKESTAFLWGNGGLEPEGLMNDPNIPEVLNGHATNLSADALIALMYGMPQQYRNRGSWALNGTVLGKLRTIKDGNGNYIWQPSLQVGQPETLLGRPVVEFVDLEDATENKFPIVYGDFSAYRIVDRLTMSTLVDPYSRAVNGITRIHATRRVGGAVLDPKRFRKLKMATS